MAQAQIRRLADVSEPTELGTTSMPSGSYMVTDESTGKSYPMTVTAQGTMVIGPAGTSTQALNTKPAGMKRGLEREVTDVIRREGTGEIQNLIK